MTRYVSLREFVAMLAFTTLMAGSVALGWSLGPDPKPHLLVGYGCEGSNGQPMYYTEESDFPPCSLIESAR